MKNLFCSKIQKNNQSSTMNTLQIERKEGYAVLQMDNGKVNAITTELSTDLAAAFRALEADKSIRGVVLTGRPHCFSAGLDVVSLATGGVEGATQFWNAYLDMAQVLARFEKPFVCAITGYAPAGATIIACLADYRIMGRGAKHVIGMHEFKMSLQIPELLCRVFAYTIGERTAWEAVLNARLYDADAAKLIGLVDEAAAVEEVLAIAEKRIQKYIKIYPPVFSRSKKYLRKGLLEAVDMDIPAMVKVILENYNDPEFMAYVAAFMQSLKKK